MMVNYLFIYLFEEQLITVGCNTCKSMLMEPTYCLGKLFAQNANPLNCSCPEYHHYAIHWTKLDITFHGTNISQVHRWIGLSDLKILCQIQRSPCADDDLNPTLNNNILCFGLVLNAADIGVI